MLNRFQKLSIVAASVAVGFTVIDIDAARAFNFTFEQEVGSNGTLTGEFSGTDTDGNRRLDAGEFTTFTSAFQGSETGFKNITWGLINLAPFSYFTGPANYTFWVTAPASNPLNGRGWRSNTELGDTVVGYAFSQDGPISDRYFSQDTLTFEPVPEPTTMAGLALAGAGVVYVRRRKQRQAQKVTKK